MDWSNSSKFGLCSYVLYSLFNFLTGAVLLFFPITSFFHLKSFYVFFKLFSYGQYHLSTLFVIFLFWNYDYRYNNYFSFYRCSVLSVPVKFYANETLCTTLLDIDSFSLCFLNIAASDYRPYHSVFIHHCIWSMGYPRLFWALLVRIYR